MKNSLKAGLSFSKTILVDEGRCITFMGEEGMVYATPKMVHDVEYTCRDFLLEHLDEGEDSVGANVSIDHLAPTPVGLHVIVEIRVAQVEKRRITFSVSVKDSIEEVGRGAHTRFIVDSSKTRERLAAKRAKAGLT